MTHTLSSRPFFRLATILSALSLVTSLMAQSDRGSIVGTVSDQSGAAIPGAGVKVRQTATNFSREAISTETGRFVTAELPPGLYDLTVTKDGFTTFTQTGITVAVGQASTVDVTLRIGQLAQRIEVQADASMLKTQSPELSTSISNNEINSLPLDFSNNIRNPMGFIKIVPGSVVNTNDGGWPVTSQNGLQSFTEEIRIDGAPATNATPGVFNEAQPSVDAIQEFSLQTSNFNAEYGNAGGAIFNFALKSGTNHLHGSAYEYLRNEFFNAKNKDLSDTDPKTKQRRHDTGATIGGPVVIPHLYDGRDKTFWFASFENFYTRDHQLSFWSVPRDEWRKGDLSSLLQPAILGMDALGRPIQQGQIYDPATTRTVTVSGQSYVVRDPFPNNQIPIRS
jgi:hypothetical protein